VDLLYQLLKVVWCEEAAPRQWREGLIVNIFVIRKIQVIAGVLFYYVWWAKSLEQQVGQLLG